MVDVAGTEEEAVAALEGCLVRLRAVRDAQQQALQALSPAEVRAAVTVRRQALIGDTR